MSDKDESKQPHVLIAVISNTRGLVSIVQEFSDRERAYKAYWGIKEGAPGSFTGTVVPK